MCDFCKPLGTRWRRGVRFVEGELDWRYRFRIVEEPEGGNVQKRAIAVA